MSEWSQFNRVIQQRWCRMLSLCLASICIGNVMWNPTYLVSHIDGFSNLTAITLLWASCGGVVHGIGYRPRSVLGQVFVFVPVIWFFFANMLIRFNWG